MAECKECYFRHESLQTHFPSKPVYKPPSPVLSIELPKQKVSKAQEKKLGREVLEELNVKWDEKFQRTLTSAIPKFVPEANLTPKVSRAKAKQDDRAKKRKLVSEVNQQFTKNTTLTVLAEAESMASYKRKRLALSFETPPPKRAKRHSPHDGNLGVDISQVVKTLKHNPPNKPVNWSEMALKLGLPQKNGGQILKQVAKDNEIEIGEQDETCETSKSQVDRW